MKEFWQVIKRYVGPYKKYLGWSVVLNVLSAIFNIFSFSIIIPMLRILFKMNDKVYEHISLSLSGMSLKQYGDGLVNNAYWYIQDLMQTRGGAFALFVLCAFLVFMTLLKTACYFGSSAVMIPIRTGVVKRPQE